MLLTVIQYRSGQYEEAHTTFRQGAEISKRISGPGFTRIEALLYNMACMSALGGETQRALAELQESVDLGLADPIALEDPDLDSLRNEPAFERILQEIKESVQSTAPA